MNTNDAYEKIIQEWNREPIRNTDDLDVRLSSFRVLFAYHSNVVENPETTLHDTREIFENGKVTGYTGSSTAPSDTMESAVYPEGYTGYSSSAVDDLKAKYDR